MCGIAGYANVHGGPPDEGLVKNLSDLLSHRGPDGAVVWVLSTEASAPTVVLGTAGWR